MPDARSPWSPLRSKLFLAIWIAALASNIGTWVQSVGEKWQMAELTTSPLLIALIETGTALPVLTLGLAAGAFADIFDRRKLLIGTQVFMMLVAGSLSALTFAHHITPTVLIAMSLMIGIGSALSMPAFQAIIPEILPREELASGVALNSAGFNVSRAVGPAIGGVVVGLFGAGWAFLLNALSFLAVVSVLWRWERKVAPTDLPAERFLGAMKVGLRYARHNRSLQVILLRSLGYVWFSGVIFSLLPALAIHQLHLGSSAFGLMLGAVGAGAVVATFLLPRLRERLSTNQLLAAFTLLAAVAQAGMAFVPHTPTVALCLMASGMSWLGILSTINTAIQLSVPSWVKARAFGTYHMVWGGAMALGAAFWGAVAQRIGLSAAFAVSAAGMVITLLFIGRLRITVLEQDMDLSHLRPAPHPPSPIAPEAGPVLVQLEYHIPPDKKELFREAMREVRHLRLRDGAMRWALFEEPDAGGEEHLTFVESYLSSSWGEHLRQHHRATMSDREVFAAAYRLDPEGRPRVRHLVASFEEPESLLDRFWE